MLTSPDRLGKKTEAGKRMGRHHICVLLQLTAGTRTVPRVLRCNALFTGLTSMNPYRRWYSLLEVLHNSYKYVKKVLKLRVVLALFRAGDVTFFYIRVDSGRNQDTVSVAVFV